MNRSINKAVVILMTAALLFNMFIFTGCSREKKDIEEIKDLTEQFIGEFGIGDAKELGKLIDGSFYYMDADRESMEILLKLASKTEILEYRSIEIDRKEKKAKAKLRISYADVYEFVSDIETGYLSKEDYLAAVDAYDDLTEKNLIMNYVFDESEDRWLIKESSAKKYRELFNYAYCLHIATVSEGDADRIFNEVFECFSRGEFELPYYELDVERMRIFDERYYDSPVITEAVEEFTRAYFKYIVDHRHSIERASDNYPYEAQFCGWAPSKYDMLDYISSDECIIGIYTVYYRSGAVFNSGISGEEDIYRMIAGIYLGLAEKIPDMAPSEFVVSFSVDPDSSPPQLSIYGDLIDISDNEVYNARYLSDEQDFRCRRQAVENLYAAGEISEELYNAYLEQIDREDIRDTGPEQVPAAATDAFKHINWEGTDQIENQAVDVIEYIPEWSDGSLIYGASEPDGNGIWMHYSKQPGWLDTAGYHYENDDMTVILRFDHKFDKGTELIYDWYINGDNYGDSCYFTVDEDGKEVFEITLADAPVSKYGTVELRLWESDHSHVIAYVLLYC